MARNNLPGLFLPFSSLIRSPKNSPGVHATCEFCKRSAKGKLRHEFLFRARVKSKLTEIDIMALLGLISWSLFVDAFRLVSICFFVVCALSINWYSFWSFIAILSKI